MIKATNGVFDFDLAYRCFGNLKALFPVAIVEGWKSLAL